MITNTANLPTGMELAQMIDLSDTTIVELLEHPYGLVSLSTPDQKVEIREERVYPQNADKNGILLGWKILDMEYCDINQRTNEGIYWGSWRVVSSHIYDNVEDAKNHLNKWVDNQRTFEKWMQDNPM